MRTETTELFSVGLEGAERLAEIWGRAPEALRLELVPALTAAQMLALGAVQEAAPAHQGALRASFRALPVSEGEDGAFSAEMGTPLDYALPVELGSRPHFPPLQPLIDWARGKLGLESAEALQAARAIQRKIGKHGTQPTFFFRDAVTAAEPQLQTILRKGAERAAKAAFTGEGS